MYDTTACTIVCCSSFPKEPTIFTRCRIIALHRLGSCRAEKKTQQAVRVVLPARILLPMPSPKHVPFWEGPTPEDGTPRVSRELRGARTPRARREKGADSGPPPEEHLPDEPAEFRLPAP